MNQEVIEKIQSHKFIVIGYENCNPLGIIRSLGENGIKSIVIMIKSKRKLASLSRYIQKKYYVSNNDEAYSLLLREYGDTKLNPLLFHVMIILLNILILIMMI